MRQAAFMSPSVGPRAARPDLRLAELSALLLALASFGGACRPAVAPLDELRSFTVGPERIRFAVRYSALDEEVAPAVEDALRKARRSVQRWGGLVDGVTMRVYPSHAALERAIGHYGYDWLRAWAQYQVIHLQAARTWGIPYEDQLDELLAHELTHVAMYQAVGTPDDWADRELPLWFREGMASVTAAQGYRRSPPDEIAAQMRADPKLSPLRPNSDLLRHRKDLVYGAAHWAFEHLLRLGGDERDGEARVRDLMRRMREGATFGAAFREIWGMSERSFVKRWYDHIRGPAPAVTDLDEGPPDLVEARARATLARLL